MSAVADPKPLARPVPESFGDAIARQRRQLREAERKVFSQFNEDGVLAHLFDRLGTTSRRFVEFGVGNGRECNTAHLSLDGGWGGLLIEGNAADAAKAAAHYAARTDRVTVVRAFVTAANIDALIGEHAGLAARTDLDLLSVDIDGNDYWVWRAITTVRPRVVVVEYNASFGHDRAVTTPYDPAFDRLAAHRSGLYAGASLPALERLGRAKGYVLVGCESHGVNAFFVEATAAAAAGLVAAPADRAYYPHAWRTDRFGPTDRQFEPVAGMPYVDV